MPEAMTAARLTAEDLPYLQPAEELWELVAGELIREPLPGADHGLVAGAVLGHLFQFVREHRSGRLYAAETGFVLARNPDTVRGPDAAYVSAERSATTVRRGPFFEGAPDLAVEVLSPGNTRREIAAKVRDYLAAGAGAVWVIDPTRRTVAVHLPGRPPETLSGNGVLDGGAVLPGFRLAVAEIFEQLPAGPAP
jgi:Uma2 family endonuclease